MGESTRELERSSDGPANLTSVRLLLDASGNALVIEGEAGGCVNSRFLNSLLMISPWVVDACFPGRSRESF